MNPDPRRWPGLAVLLLAAFMDFVDVSIVLIAAPVIQADLDATYAEIQWMVAGLAFSAAPVISGLLLQLDLFGLSWRPVFLVNVPVGLAALAGAAVLVRESKADVPPATDLAGLALSSAGILLLLLYPLIQGNDLDWPLWAFAMMAAAVPVLALFARYEARRERQGRLPLVPMSLFHQRSFTAGLLCALVVYSAVASFFFVLVIQLQAGHGLSPLRTGLITVAWPVGIGITSNLAVRLAGRLGRGLVSVGTLLVIACMLLLVVAIQGGGGTSTLGR
jgi:predicted MFS family arabinose efflux permease